MAITSPVRLARGPRKQRPEEPPAPRLSTHKARSTWFRARAAWPYRDASTSNLVAARVVARKALAGAPIDVEWEMAGPTNIGGRVTCLVCHPAHPDRIWIGAAGGGVWFSPDAGRTWSPQWHAEDVLNVGALAIDRGNPDLLYCGTGEANLSADSYPGVGVYRSTDGGSTWHLHAGVDRTAVPRRIGVIAIDPFESSHIVLGGVGFAEVSAENDVGGLYQSANGGVTWQRDDSISQKNYWCHSIVFDPSTRGTVYATITTRGVASGIYRSKNGGKTWEQLTKGLGATERFGRTTLAISPSSPKVLYAIAQDMLSGRADLLLGVFRTLNGGDSWKNVAGTHFADEGQMSYGNTIAIHPTNPNHVLCGGVDLHLTTNGGRTWSQVSRWDADRANPDYAHADHHGLVMPVGAPGRVYDSNDGGLDVSEDGGRTWQNRSNGLAVTMYYDFDVAQSDGRVYGGGSQDNGTLITVDGAAATHFELLGGDGGWITFDPTDANHVFASYYNFHIYRFHGEQNKNVSPPAPPAERNSVWMCFIAMDPTNPDRLFTASRRIWRTLNDGNTWAAVSPSLDDSNVSAIEIARADPQRIYVGTENGSIFRSTDGGGSWSANLATAELPGYAITRLATHPQDADVVYVTVANVGHSHVYRSTDAGLTWEDVDKGRLPDVPHHCVVVPPDAPATVFVCHDVGVAVSTDAGATWADLSLNLPHVMVVDLAFHAADGALYAATYGRSVWRLRLKAALDRFRRPTGGGTTPRGGAARPVPRRSSRARA